MDESDRIILARRYAAVSNRLNTDAYHQQMKGRTKPLKQFVPCQRALVFTAAISKGLPAAAVILYASLEHCACHPQLSESDLWELYLGEVRK